MSRVITKEVFAEAVTLGREFLPKLTAVELAQVLGISVVHMLRCLAANKEHVKLDGDKNVLGFVETGMEMTMSITDLWKWHVTTNCGGDESKAIAAKSQTDLSKVIQGRLSFSTPFEHVVCAFLTEEREGGNVKNQIASKWGDNVARLVTCVADVKGNGQVVDKYLYAVVLTADNAKVLAAAGLHPFVTEVALKQVSNTRGWADYEVPSEPKNWERWDATINIDVPADTLKPMPAPAITESAVVPKSETQAATAGEDEVKRRTRRTKEQLIADRQKMIASCVAAGIPQASAEQAILTPEKQGDAEKAAQTLLDSLKTQSFTATPAPALDTATLIAAAPKPPSFAPAPAPTVSDLKASIRENAAAPAPVTPVAAPVAIAAQAAVASGPSAISGAGSVGPAAPAAPTAPATSAMAATLLDSLLSSTGQKS